MADYIAKAIPCIMDLVSDIKSMKDLSDGKGGSRPTSLMTIRNPLQPDVCIDKLAIEGWFWIKINISLFSYWCQRKKWENFKNNTCPRAVLQEWKQTTDIARWNGKKRSIIQINFQSIIQQEYIVGMAKSLALRGQCNAITDSDPNLTQLVT